MKRLTLCIVLLSVLAATFGRAAEKRYYEYPTIDHLRPDARLLVYDPLSSNRNITGALLHQAAMPERCVDYYDGRDGAPNSLAIGTVTTGAAGSAASATITGTAPSQTLNLTIPKGDAGASASVTKPAVVSALADATADNLGITLQPGPTDAATFALFSTRDRPGNVRWYVDASGTMFQKTSAGKTRMKITTDGEITQYRGDGTTPAFRVYSSGRLVL